MGHVSRREYRSKQTKENIQTNMLECMFNRHLYSTMYVHVTLNKRHKFITKWSMIHR